MKSSIQAVFQQDKPQQSVLMAKILICLAFYCFIAAVILEQFSPIIMLKSIAIILSMHAFYFLFKSQQ